MTEDQALAQLATLTRMKGRLEAGEPLRLLVGLGAGASEIMLTETYVDEIRRDLLKSIALRIDEARAALEEPAGGTQGPSSPPSGGRGAERSEAERGTESPARPSPSPSRPAGSTPLPPPEGEDGRRAHRRDS